MSQIILPKGHLSFSQMILWQTARETYRKKYYPEVRLQYGQTPEMAFGNFITEEMEKNNPLFDFIPRYDTFEYPQNENPKVEFNVGGIIVEAYIDQLDRENVRFREQKTGRTPWNQHKVNSHIQLDLYSMLLEDTFGKVDDECELIWVPTRKKVKEVTLVDGSVVQGESSEIECVGPCDEFPLGYVIFKRIINGSHRAIMKNLVVQIGREISEDYAALKHLYNDTK